MKKNSLLVAGLVLFAVVSASAEGGLIMTPKAGMQFGVYENYVAAGARADYFFGTVLGLGLDADIAWGLTYADAYTNVLAMLDLGLFYLGAGVSLRVAQPASPAIVAEQSAGPALATGFLFQTFALGPGKLSFNLDLCAYPSAFTVDTSNTDNFFAAIFSAIAQGVAGVLFSAVKLEAQIGYSVTL